MTPILQTRTVDETRPAWTLWATLGWSLVLLAVMSIAGLVPLVILARIEGIDLSGGLQAVAGQSNPARLSSLESIAMLGPVSAVIW